MTRRVTNTNEMRINKYGSLIMTGGVLMTLIIIADSAFTTHHRCGQKHRYEHINTHVSHPSDFLGGTHSSCNVMMRRSKPAFQLSNHIDYDHNNDNDNDYDYTKYNNNNNNNSKIDDVSRRTLLKSILTSATSSAAISSIIMNSNIVANAVDEDLLDIDQKKVVMQVSAKNVPEKYANPTSSSSASSSSTTCSTNLDSKYRWMTTDEARRIDIFEKAAPSVVFIDTYVEARDPYSTNVMEVPIGTGSGFVWDEKGHIVTNYHVVRSAKSAQIAILTRKFDDSDDIRDDDDNTTPSKRKQARAAASAAEVSTASELPELPIRNTSMRNDAGVTNFARKVYKAKVVGVDPGKDIAVLKIDAPVYDLFPIDVGTSTGLKVGQSAYAIGNPFGLDHTLTVGVLSGIGREVKSPIGRPITNVIQTDAAINPGNSGGPLLNSIGKLIGMNTSIYSPSGASAGIGFAIPIDTVKFIVETLIRDGRVVRPVMGISFLESKQARALGIEKGVLVLDVPTTSPAFKAGMRGTRRTESGLVEIGDIIIKVDDTKISTEADLFAALESFKPGDVVKVTVNRVDLETPSQAKLTPKVLSITLKASDENAISRYLYADPGK
jgi:S1-C subfamily serine protease